MKARRSDVLFQGGKHRFMGPLNGLSGNIHKKRLADIVDLLLEFTCTHVLL